MKHLLLIIMLFFHFTAFTQKNVVAKSAPNAIGSAGGAALVNNVTYTWTIGEPVIFTGASPNGFLTQGFNQPMICKSLPVIVAFNQTSCALPYTLSVTSGFNYYQWKLGKSTIANANSFAYNPVTDGKYTVWVGDSTGCYVPSSPVSVDLSIKNIIPTVTVYGSAAKDTLLESSLSFSYQWYVITPSDGIHRAIVGANLQIYKPLYNGTYYVKINTEQNCEAYSQYVVINNTTWDIINRNNSTTTDSTIDIRLMKPVFGRKLSVYPIPSHDMVNIDYESPEINTVVMNFYNVQGVLVASKRLKNNTGKVHCVFERNDLPTGSYLLSVLDGENKAVQNIILE